LRIVDASIMPSIVRANTHLPVLMIGERAADLIQSDND
jgi:choline dehydrogenase-like flavoprotein